MLIAREKIDRWDGEMVLRGASGGHDRGMRGPSPVTTGARNHVPEKYHSAIPSTRGYIKLSQASTVFNFDFRGKTVLDIGSSTGGFTQYALDHGAKKVIAVEKGTNQMQSPLRHDPRISLYEKTNIFDFKLGTGSRNTFFEGPPEPGKARMSAGRPWRRAGRTQSEKKVFGQNMLPDVIVADVSFVSLTKILKYAKIHLARSDTDFFVMLKPQFEAYPTQLNKGVVKNETVRRQIIKDFEHWLKQNGFLIVKKCDNTLTGKTGNKERFYWLKLQKKSSCK